MVYGDKYFLKTFLLPFFPQNFILHYNYLTPLLLFLILFIPPQFPAFEPFFLTHYSVFSSLTLSSSLPLPAYIPSLPCLPLSFSFTPTLLLLYHLLLLLLSLSPSKFLPISYLFPLRVSPWPFIYRSAWPLSAQISFPPLQSPHRA